MTNIAELSVRDRALFTVAASSLCIAAFDPGLGGALSFYFPRLDRLLVEDMPVVAGNIDAATLAARIRQMAPDLAIVEIASSRPGQGVSSVFRFGAGYGAILGVLAALNVPTHLVAASKWKRHFNLDADKERSRELALRLWPERADLFSRKRDHGRSEAALLARYGAEREFPEAVNEPASREGTPPGAKPGSIDEASSIGAQHDK